MPSLVDRLYLSFGVTTPFDPDKTFVTSPFTAPSALCINRGIRATYTMTIALVSLVVSACDGTFTIWFTDFAKYSYVSASFYFVFSFYHTLIYWRTGRYPLASWPRIFQLLHSILYSSIGVFPGIMTVIYWTIQADSSTFATPLNIWLNVSLHLASTVFIFTEILSNSIRPLSLPHVVVLELCFLLYLPIVYICAATLGFYPFTSLDPSTPSLLAGSILSMIAAIAAMFIILQGLASSKLYILRSNDKPAGKLSKKDPNYTESELPTHMPPGSRASSTTQIDGITTNDKDGKVDIELKDVQELSTRAKSDSVSTLQSSPESKSDFLTAVMECTRAKSDSVSTVQANDSKYDPDVISIIDCTRRKSDSVSTVRGSTITRVNSDVNTAHPEKVSKVESILEASESKLESSKEHVEEAGKPPSDDAKKESVPELPTEPTRSKSGSVSSGGSSDKTDADTIFGESI